MNHEKPAETRVKELEGLRAYGLLSNNPEWQAEAIAEHYVKLADMALQLRKLVKIRNRAGHLVAHPTTDAVIARMVEDIKGHHWNDFGIALEWPLNSLA